MVFIAWPILLLETASNLITVATQEGFKEAAVVMLMSASVSWFSGIQKYTNETVILLGIHYLLLAAGNAGAQPGH